MLTLIIFVSICVISNSVFAINAWRFPGCGCKVTWLSNGLVSCEHKRKRTVLFAEAKRIEIDMVEQSVGDLYESSVILLRVTDAHGICHLWQSSVDRDSRKGGLITSQVSRLEAEFGAKVKRAQTRKQEAEDSVSRMLNRAYVRYSRLFG